MRLRHRLVRWAASFAALGTGAAACLLLGFSSGTTACAQRECLATWMNWGDGPNQGNLIDENHWESTANDAIWLSFVGQRTWHFLPGPFQNRRIANVTVWFSPDEQPSLPGNQYSLASGNAAVVDTTIDNGRTAIDVHNDTCADFFVRVLIEAYPEPAPALDAGSGDAVEGGPGPQDGSSVDGQAEDGGDRPDAADAGTE